MRYDKRFIGRAQMQDAFVIRWADGQSSRGYRNRANKAIRACQNREFRKMLRELEV